MLVLENGGAREIQEVDWISFSDGINVVDAKMEDGGQQGTGGEESEAGNTDLTAEIVGPTKEEAGDDGDRRIRVRPEPEGDRLTEEPESGHDRRTTGASDILDVFDAGRDRRVGRERESDGGDGRGMGGEKWGEETEVPGGDDDGDSEATEAELVGQV